jgi:shikimate kinase
VNLLLIGLRGAGKSVCGAAAAARLGLTFVDLDALVAAELGASGVAAAWHEAGEGPFREAEVAVLRRVLARDGLVVACGGGTPTAPGAAQAIRAERSAGRARVVYLRASAPTLAARLRVTDLLGRPSLTGAGTLEEVPAVLAQRDGPYLGAADLVIQTDALTAPETVALLVAAAGAALPTPGRPA